MKADLRKKAVAAILIMAFILCGASVFVSYTIHSSVMDKHYRELAQNIASATAVTVNSDLVQRYTDAVKEIYLANPRPEFNTEEEEAAYFKQYDSIMDEQYEILYGRLSEIKQSNVVLSLYIIYVDADSRSSVYIIDADKTQTRCPIGTWEEVEEYNYNIFTNPEEGFDSYITDTEKFGWICSSGAAIMDDNGQVIAYAMVDLLMEEVMKERYGFLRMLCIIVSIITVIILLIFIFAVNRSIVLPINRLSETARGFVNNMNNQTVGKHQSAFADLNIRSGDEIQRLLESFKFMEQEIYEYIDNLSRVTSEKERIGAELNIANKIQADMLPSIFPAFPHREEFDIYAIMDPAKEVGGDFYDFFMVDERHLAIVIADVSGKGIPAALFMVIGKTLIKDHTQSGAALDKVFYEVNNILCESNNEGLFITAFEGVLDLFTGEFVYVNAGHENPYIYRKGGEYSLYELEPGFVLAGMSDMDFAAGRIMLGEGDKLFQFTDGVTDAINVHEELYGVTRLEAVLNRNVDKKPADLLNSVKSDIDSFVGEAEQFDDITMLCIEYKHVMKA